LIAAVGYLREYEGYRWDRTVAGNDRQLMARASPWDGLYRLSPRHSCAVYATAITPRHGRYLGGESGELDDEDVTGFGPAGLSV
jgi:hypothetical protein